VRQQTNRLNGGELLVELGGVEGASKLWCPWRRDVAIVEQIPVQAVEEAMGLDLGSIRLSTPETLLRVTD
jgi:hypothetical protein